MTVYNTTIKLIITVFLCILAGCSTENTNSNFINAEVNRVVDGDTLNVSIDGKEETVRLLLVDTPETVHPTKPVEPFGPEASTYMKKLLTGNKVDIELDVGERDKYGRLLAYIYFEEKMVNKLLLEKGLARVAYVFEPNTKYVDEFYEIQKQAQNKAIGIWSLENYATDEGFNSNEESSSVVEDELAHSVECTIKGNINSKGEKIYHTEASPSYKVTKPEEMFCSKQEAEAAGYRAIKR
ncbi:thermonuclease family protein [Metabacillus litoralis]|uniref:Thermonuclease family protein n=1 Tax=Metabacillus litoralis TaxID=152268 RepID=A0A5C6W4M6_9BACI|nr:thermonuclease family protein [Metabacillus litoralis]TXC91496.1 thermonuclease family protein [Metabacillus litoralis]